MLSTPVVPPVRRRPAVHRHRGPVQPGAAAARTAAPHPGPGGLAGRRAQLEARWRDRLERITELSLAYHEERASAAAGRAAEPDSAESRRARQLARQAVAERQALAEIEAALNRIGAGQYGWCEQCGRPVAAAILAAQPEARYCGACGRAPAARHHHPHPGQRIACA